MPYALFCHDAKLSKTYPTEADVWKRARQSGLLVDITSGEDGVAAQSVFEHDYEIRPCPPEPLEDLAENHAEAEWRVERDFVPHRVDGDTGHLVFTNAGASGARSVAAWRRAMAMRIRVLTGGKTAWARGRDHR